MNHPANDPRPNPDQLILMAARAAVVNNLREMKPAHQMDRLHYAVELMAAVAGTVDPEVLETAALEIVQEAGTEHDNCQHCQARNRALGEFFLAIHGCCVAEAGETLD